MTNDNTCEACRGRGWAPHGVLGSACASCGGTGERARCIICGEGGADAEMHKDGQGGMVHAECGIVAGWEVA